MAYKSKYRLTRDESLKGYEVRKIMDGIDKETQRQEFWRNCTFSVLLGMVIFAIILLGGH